tara:strand:+ start:1569 stop:2402 length:834 start_codon:yes stop_codon:yes gene_type:complete
MEARSSILLFPFRGGELLQNSQILFPAKYWYTWAWLIDLMDYGATLSWDEECVTVEYDNILLSAAAGDQSLQTIFMEMFDDDEYRLKNYSIDGLSVLDVGANIGDSPIMFMKMGARSVCALEPLPALEKYLKMNIQQNGLSDSVEIHLVGLSDKNETVKIHMREQGTAGSSAVLHLKEKIGLRPGYIEQDLNLVHATEYLKKHNINDIDVLKMDCEHCEYVVFQTPEFLEYLSPKMIFLEYHNGYESLRTLFVSKGYEVVIHKKNEKVGIIIATLPL